MEKVKEFLKTIGVGEDIQSNLFSEEVNEEFNASDAANEYVKKRQALTLNNPDILSGLKQKFNNEQYPAIAKPIIKKLQALGGLSSEQIKEITEDGKSLPDLKRLIDLAGESFKKNAAGTTDEVKEQLFALKNEYNAAKDTWTTERETMQSGFKEERRMSKVKSRFNQAVSGLDTILDNQAAEQLLQTSLFGQYRFDVNEQDELVVTTSDGRKVDDGNSFLSASDLIKQTADRFKILKKSNGGEGGKPPASGGHTPTFKPGEMSENTKKMIESFKNNQ